MKYFSVFGQPYVNVEGNDVPWYSEPIVDTLNIKDVVPKATVTEHNGLVKLYSLNGIYYKTDIGEKWRVEIKLHPLKGFEFFSSKNYNLNALISKPGAFTGLVDVVPLKNLLNKVHELEYFKYTPHPLLLDHYKNLSLEPMKSFYARNLSDDEIMKMYVKDKVKEPVELFRDIEPILHVMKSSFISENKQRNVIIHEFPKRLREIHTKGDRFGISYVSAHTLDEVEEFAGYMRYDTIENGIEPFDHFYKKVKHLLFSINLSSLLYNWSSLLDPNIFKVDIEEANYLIYKHGLLTYQTYALITKATRSYVVENDNNYIKLSFLKEKNYYLLSVTKNIIIPCSKDLLFFPRLNKTKEKPDNTDKECLKTDRSSNEEWFIVRRNLFRDDIILQDLLKSTSHVKGSVRLKIKFRLFV